MAATPASATTPSPRLWRFGAVQFDEGSWELQMDGAVVEVERKPLEVLSVLLDHAGKVVTKDQLVQLAWPGRIITDAALAKSIARLREAIGDADHQIVRTHHRYGYRLVADVSLQAAGPVVATQTVPAAAPAPMTTPRLDPEHRVLTMLFCDLVDSTRMAEALDPEIFRSLLLDYQRNAAEIVRRYEGHVAQQFGDGMLFYFGYPDAHDDDAERALRCACELLRFASQAGSYTRLALRIGVHTGAVVIGSSGPGAEVQATGANLNIAARIQSLAEPNSILASDATFRLVPGLFVTRDFGPQTLRGMTQPVRVHQVLQPGGARSRLDAQARLTPFVGRDKEIALVESCWREAVEGRGQALVFTGEPGIGKSRLLMQLRSHLAGSAYTWLEGRSDALNRHSAFHVVAELLRRGFALKDSDDDALRTVDLERGLDDLDLDPDAAIPLLAPLINLPATARYPESRLPPEQKRARTLDTLSRWITRLADEQPLVLVVEDLHWCDDSTLEFLALLLAKADTLPLLVVATTRPEFSPGWTAHSIHRRTLDALAPSEVKCMLENLAGQRLSSDLTQLVYERAGGVPLFIEELARSLQESGDTRDTDAVPASLDSLLLARLDRLGSARELIQVASVIGREVPYALLRRVAGLDEPTLRARLDQLGASGLLYGRGAAPAASYVFKHALIADSAYRTLLRSRRQLLHGRVARELETHFPDRAQAEPERLAAHFEKAGEIEVALRHYKSAGDSASAAGSLREAVAHCERALQLLLQLPDSATRRILELDLNLTVANCRAKTMGWDDVGAEAAFQRAESLCELVEDAELLGRAFGNIWLLRYGRTDFFGALELAQKGVVVGRRIGNDAILHIGLAEMGWCLVNLGRLAETRDCGEQAHALLDPVTTADAYRMLRFDPLWSCLTPLSKAQWLMGFPDLALRTARCVADRDTQQTDPFGRTVSLLITLVPLRLLRREPEPVAELCAEALALSERHGLREWAAYSNIYRGLAECMLGRADEGLPRVRAGLADLASSGNLAFYSQIAAMLTEQCSRFGLSAEAHQVLASGWAFVQRSGERFMEAELHRVNGELLRIEQPNDPAPAAASFEKALEVAKGQGARALELRAATSLARLLHELGRSAEAKAGLAPVYAGFTEGFDTPDLRDAAALLATLS